MCVVSGVNPFRMANTSMAEVDDANDSNRIAARHADLILAHHAAQQRIAELEGIVAQYNDTGAQQRMSEAQENVPSTDSPSGRIVAPLRRRLSVPLLDQPFKKDGLRRITDFNVELVETIDQLRNSMLKMETDAHVQVILLGNEVERLCAEKDALRHENEALKERVANDVLRQRQANLVEMGMEKAKMAARTRSVGMRCLENTEAMLMERNDDMYYVQRFDSAKLPARDVTFVVQIVGGVVFPPSDGEEFTLNSYRKLLYNIARQHGGYHVTTVRNLDVFALQSATAAVRFARDCHLGVLEVEWHTRTSKIPFFAPLIDSGVKLFSGPRMHTCLYSVASPDCEVDPVTGRAIYFGAAIRDAIHSAITGAPIGEIVANAAWGELFVRESRLVGNRASYTMSPSSETEGPDVAEVRARLGPNWSIVAAHTHVESLRYSVLPESLELRRGLPPYLLHPTDRFCSGDAADADNLLQDALCAMKGVSRLACGPQESWVESFTRHDGRGNGSEASGKSLGSLGIGGDASGVDFYALCSLRRERENMVRLYRKLEAACARHEQNAMVAEDRYASRRRVTGEKETVFVCTVDTGSDDTWRAMSQGTTAALHTHEEEAQLREELIATVHGSGWRCDGFLVNGDLRRVFTYAFREPEQVLEFSAQVYAVIEGRVEKLSRTRSREFSGNRSPCLSSTDTDDLSPSETCISSVIRCGIACGPLQPFEPFNLPLTATAARFCRGPAVTVSGTLCDMARCGEILATAEVIQAFYGKRGNIAKMAYNVLRLGCRFLGPGAAGVDVCSVLPKLFAARRQSSPFGPCTKEEDSIILSGSLNIKRLSGSAANMNTQRMSVSTASIPMRKSNRKTQSFIKTRGKTNGNNNEMIGIALQCSTLEAQRTHSVRAALCLDAPLLTRAEVSTMLEQQRRMLERGEAAMMASHDTAWDLTVQQQLRIGWVLSGTACIYRKELVFLYCDAFGVSRLISDLPAELCADVLAQYNYTVQSALLAHCGVVARTDGVSAYIALFRDPQEALEAALAVQRGLLAADWPVHLHTLEETLYVRSAVSGNVLFRGVRAAVALHSSTAYAPDASGVAMQMVLALGRATRGGEVLVALPALARVSASLSGTLLLQQLDSRAALSLLESAGVAAASCALRAVSERHGLFAPAGAGGAAATGGAGPRPQSNRRRVSEWFAATGALTALPPARRVRWEAAKSESRAMGDVGRVADALTARIKREVASTVETSTFRDGFLAVARDTLAGFAAACHALDDAVTKADSAKETSVLLPQLSMTATVTNRSMADAPRNKTLSRVISSTGRPQDPFHVVLHAFDKTLRTVQQHSASLLSGGLLYSSTDKRLPVRPPAPRTGQKKNSYLS